MSRVLLYGFESSAVFKSAENKISVFEWKIFEEYMSQ